MRLRDNDSDGAGQVSLPVVVLRSLNLSTENPAFSVVAAPSPCQAKRCFALPQR